MNKLYVVGAGSQAKYVIENLKNSSLYKVEGLIDIENRENVGKKINDIPVIAFIEDNDKYFSPADGFVIVAYGDNQRKKETVMLLKEKKYSFATIIAKNSYISDHVDVGEGSIINPNVTIMPNTKVGSHVIIHSGCVIEHDNDIGDYSNIAPRVATAGNVEIGEATYIYTGAIVCPKIKIGNNSVVGAGAVVLKDVADNTTVVGIPAKSIRKD